MRGMRASSPSFFLLLVYKAHLCAEWQERDILFSPFFEFGGPCHGRTILVITLHFFDFASRQRSTLSF